MECNATSTKGPGVQAFTMAELLVAMGVGSIVMIAVMVLIFFTGRSYAALVNYTELDKYSRNALDQMVYKIRQANELTSYSSTKLVFTFQVTNTLTYEYSPTYKTLTERVTGARDKVLLKGCDNLTFQVFQRNTAAGSYDQFPITLTNVAAKLVQLNWTCSRNVLGARVNTESVQSAKIVIRNQ
jgi:Tfp pilus assembly protein PilW